MNQNGKANNNIAANGMGSKEANEQIIQATDKLDGHINKVDLERAQEVEKYTLGKMWSLIDK